MKSEKNIMIAFLLNLFFSVFEIIGALLTNSVSILSDAIHDFLDSVGIGISYFLEKKSKKEPDDLYTYGYSRYSILGALITTLILLISGVAIIYHSILRIFNPIELKSNLMIIIALFGIVINYLAAYFTKDGETINQKTVNLHMLEDVLGWLVVFAGSILIKITKILWIDSIMSIVVSIFIVIRAARYLLEIFDIFVLKVPKNVDINEIKNHLLNIKGVKDVHHIHIWSLDGKNNFATLHVVSDTDVKKLIRKELKEHNIKNATIEIEDINEKCNYKKCKIEDVTNFEHHH